MGNCHCSDKHSDNFATGSNIRSSGFSNKKLDNYEYNSDDILGKQNTVYSFNTIKKSSSDFKILKVKYFIRIN